MDWKLVDYRATATWAGSTASVDTLNLRAGLTIESGNWQGSVIGALPAMQPSSSPASVETYVRGADLVTTHPATTERPTRVQLYWRRWHGLPTSISAALELIVSVQTHLLDSDPALVLESRFNQACAELSSVGMVEVTQGENCALILTDPQDATQTEFLREPDALANCVVRHTLFRQRLEKGVILRGRLLYCWSDQALTSQVAAEFQARFLSTEPMLTT